MPNDQPFRNALLVGMCLFVPVMAYFRIRSQLTGERLDRRQEGWFILISLRLVAAVGAAVMIAFLGDPSLTRWSSLPLPEWLRWSGISIGAAAYVWVIWTFSHLGKNLTDTVVTRREHTLVVSGPYRWIRHPFYIGVAGAVVCASLATTNWLVAITGLTVLGLLVARTDREEAKLVERFGADYRTYMARTGCFCPRWRA
ncbi:MAG: isoprenylcysteine carboxylmethyltransferase family protein [Planctomycetales bacterium]|nr:isoprenylcysteine carboxylmethyltransferase family protein [Planctomycetales bacterium]